MILPPLVIGVRIRENSGRDFRVWVPFVLLWPLLLIIVVPAIVVAMIVDVALWASGADYHAFTMLLLGALRLLAETRGTHVHVNGHDDRLVDVDIY